MTVILALAAVTLLVLFAGRYGADSRTGADPTGRDAAWPTGPVRHHGPIRDLRLVRAVARVWAGQLRAHEAWARHQRPWETDACPQALTPRW